MRAVIISGDRNALTEKWMPVIIQAIHMETEHMETEGDSGVVVLHGAAKGIDAIAATVCSFRTDCAVVPIPAQWERIGRAAGPIRNKVMLDILSQLYEHGYNVGVHCFHDNIAQSKGTKDMHNRAIASGFTTIVWTSDGQARESTEKIA